MQFTFRKEKENNRTNDVSSFNECIGRKCAQLKYNNQIGDKSEIKTLMRE